jgi:uncharacterized protein (TIGR03000 family)
MFRKASSFGGMLLLVGAAIFVAPGFAQARGGGGHGGGGHGGGHFSGAHFGGYRGGFYHGGAHYGGYHYGYHPYYGSYGYYSPYYYGAYPYVWSSPTYDAGYSSYYGNVAPYSADGVTSLAQSVSNYQAFYPPVTITTQPDASAEVTVKVPADARVWIDGTRTTSTGTVRQFESPPLTSGNRYSYEIQARWKENGQEVTQTQDVAIAAGAHVEVDFPKAPKTSEKTPAPQKR